MVLSANNREYAYIVNGVVKLSKKKYKIVPQQFASRYVHVQKVGCHLACRMYFAKLVFHITRIFNVISYVQILEYTLKL